MFEFEKVCCGNGGEKLFQLAEGLLKKHIASHGLHEPEGLPSLSYYYSLVICRKWDFIFL